MFCLSLRLSCRANFLNYMIFLKAHLLSTDPHDFKFDCLLLECLNAVSVLI